MTRTIESGSVIGLRLYDLYEAIDLEKAGAELKSDAAERRATLSFRAPRRIESIFRRRAVPLRLELGGRNLELEGAPGTRVQVSLDLYDFGTIATIIEMPLQRGTSLDEARRLVLEAGESEQLTDLARAEIERIRSRLSASVRGAHEWRKEQAYAVLFIQDGGGTAAELAAWEGLPSLMSADERAGAPSEATIADMRTSTDSWYQDDLVAIGSDAALVVEPSGNRELLDLLQFALSQLLQLRFYDEALDRELKELRAGFSRRRRGMLALFRSYGLLMRDVSRQLVDITAFTERIENSLKVLGDDYAARVYDKATERLGVLLLVDSVAQKQKLVADIYEVLSHEAESTRSLVLELTIVGLIAVEIFLAFGPGH